MTANNTKQRLRVEDLWTLQRPGTPTLSPDGAWACVAVTRYDMEQNEGTTRLWLFPTRGGKGRLLTQGDHDSEPQWSPDGKWIAFTAKRDKDDIAQVYLISPDGGEARRLSKLSTGAAALRWFPNSKRIAFISWVWPELSGDKAQAARLKERKGDKVKAHVTERMTYRYWDHWITEGRVPHVFAVDIANGAARDLLANTGLALLLQEPGAPLFDVSPDGKELALTVDLDPEPKWGNDYDIVVVAIGGNTQRKPKWKNLTQGSKRSNAEPRYSPDGKWLVYLSANWRRSLDDQPRLMLRRRASGETRVLAGEWDCAPANVAWLADSRTLVFNAEDGGRQPLFRLALDAAAPTKIVSEGTIQGYALSGDGSRIVFNRSTLSAPPAVFACNSDGSEERAIEKLNARHWARQRLGAVKEFTLKGAEGGSVQMWVTYPPNFDAKKKWPLLQLIHGGPHSAWLDMFHFRWNSHVFAAQGYVVAAVNYHGSTGWGQTFIESNNTRYGEQELADVEAATDFLLRRGYIDRERLFAAGGSYGGYMVAYMNGNTERYRAYVCHAGCYDWMSMMATDVYQYFNYELGAFHWDDEAHVLKQSPHHFAKHFRTPTLVIHGELDFRVPATQALQYYDTLKTLQVPARLVYFPDENHWILKPQNSRLWTREFLAWLKRWDEKPHGRKSNTAREGGGTGRVAAEPEGSA